MGGSGSGRRGGRLTVQDVLTLKVSEFSSLYSLVPDEMATGVLRWRNLEGKEIAAINAEVRLNSDNQNGFISLAWQSTDPSGGASRRCDNRIELIARRQPFGGLRWWFVCPLTGKRAAKLYLPLTSSTFASRQAHRLVYTSQMTTERERALQKFTNLRHKLGDKELDDFVLKPKGMHWATYNRLKAKADEAEKIYVAELWRHLANGARGRRRARGGLEPLSGDLFR